MKLPDFSHRHWLPDQLRGWAVIWMVLVHSVEVFLQQSEWTHPIAQIAFFLGAVPAAPIFMLLMGYYALSSGKNQKKSLLPDLIYRPLKLIFWGLLLNIGLNANLLIHSLFGSLRVDPLHYIFGVDILILAGFSLFFVGLLKRISPHWILWFLLAVLVAFFGNRFAWEGDGSSWTHFFQALVGGHFSWSYFPLFPWMAYPLAGAGFFALTQQYPELISRARYRFFAVIPALALFLLFVPQGWNTSTNLPAYYHHGKLFFIWALSFMLVLALLIWSLYRYRSAWIPTAIRFLGVRVTSFYVIQWLLIGNIGTIFYQSLSLLSTLGLFLILLPVSAYLTHLYYQNKIKNELQS